MTRTLRLSSFLAFLAFGFVALMVSMAVRATRELSELGLVTAVSCDRPRGRVFVAGRGEVRILDEAGHSLGLLLARIIHEEL